MQSSMKCCDWALLFLQVQRSAYNSNHLKEYSKLSQIIRLISISFERYIQMLLYTFCETFQMKDKALYVK